MLILAAVLLVILCLAHSLLGEKYIISHIVKLDDFPARTGDVRLTHAVIRLAWHATSILWLGLAGLLLTYHIGTDDPVRAFLIMMCGVFAVSGVISLVGIKGRHPSWFFFLAIAALCGWAAFG